VILSKILLALAWTSYWNWCRLWHWL